MLKKREEKIISEKQTEIVFTLWPLVQKKRQVSSSEKIRSRATGVVADERIDLTSLISSSSFAARLRVDVEWLADLVQSWGQLIKLWRSIHLHKAKGSRIEQTLWISDSHAWCFDNASWSSRPSHILHPPPSWDTIFMLMPFHGVSWLTHVRDKEEGCPVHVWLLFIYFLLGLRLAFETWWPAGTPELMEPELWVSGASQSKSILHSWRSWGPYANDPFIPHFGWERMVYIPCGGAVWVPELVSWS